MAVAMRTNNYFELRNREMGFYTELRTAIILARINVDRTALRLFRESERDSSPANRPSTPWKRKKEKNEITSYRFMRASILQSFACFRLSSSYRVIPITNTCKHCHTMETCVKTLHRVSAIGVRKNPFDSIDATSGLDSRSSAWNFWFLSGNIKIFRRCTAPISRAATR